MRSMQECKEEIFRRGAEKIKKEKRQKKIAVGVCLPLCLSLCILAGTQGELIRSRLAGEKSSSVVSVHPESAEGTPELGQEEVLEFTDGMDFSKVEEEVSAETWWHEGDSYSGYIGDHSNWFGYGTSGMEMIAGTPTGDVPTLPTTAELSAGYVYSLVDGSCVAELFESERLHQILSCLQELTEAPTQSTEAMGEPVSTEGYLIELYDTEGILWEFRLSDRVLENVTNACRRNLSDSEAALVLALLGLE
ncbi:MAG: hypothetical protein IKT58_00475 [Oscillospiraceae bacterium]|nr:hypothetical protein [Oscillospiraceae bacterium]